MNLNLQKRSNAGLTRFEVLVVLLLIILLFSMVLAMLLPVEAAAHRRAARVYCVNNLKQLGLADQSWERASGASAVGDSGLAGLNSGQTAWIDFAGYSNLLASAKILRCPIDQVKPAGSPDFNIRISYFLNLNSKESHPKMVLFGDDNLTIGIHALGLDRPPGSMGVPGNADLSLKAGVWQVSTNLPVAWDDNRHGNFEGNAAFTDGSVSELSSSGIINAFQQGRLATNRLAIP
jgi:prepilin-type processing-associated H-X9-DG protein